MPDPRERPVLPAERARPDSAPPSPERLDELARAIRSGSYRVDPARVAEAMVRASRDRPERRG